MGRRQGEVDRTRSAILAAARDVVSEHGRAISMGTVAERAGVSRITLYNQFGSKERLLEALAAGMSPRAGNGPAPESTDPRDDLRRHIEQVCVAWSADPSVYRRLESHLLQGHNGEHHALAARLASHDQLRPGCSIKEAEDVIGALTSFAVFDRLHKDGRRSPTAVAEILMRMAAEFLA